MNELTESERAQQASVENLLATLSGTDLSLRMIETRARQILDRRPDLDRLVSPIFFEVDTLRVIMSKARGILGTEWITGQATNWKNNGA